MYIGSPCWLSFLPYVVSGAGSRVAENGKDPAADAKDKTRRYTDIIFCIPLQTSFFAPLQTSFLARAKLLVAAPGGPGWKRVF